MARNQVHSGTLVAAKIVPVITVLAAPPAGCNPQRSGYSSPWH
jgi:hypothetical protein